MARKIVVELLGDASSLERAFKKSSKDATKFNQNMSRQGKTGGKMFGGLAKGVGLVTGALGVAGLAGAAKAAFDELQNAQQVSAQTAAALKSTGGAANVTAKQVDQLADSMLQKTGIDDEATKTAENMLLTFTNVRNEVGKGNKIFDQATQAVADMATRMNGGAIPSAEKMQQVALQLGKALNDPVKGIGALRRVGVQFTDAQQKQIKTLVATGHTMQAQKIIMAELRKEFGGSAVAAGSTLAGSLTKLRNIALNLGASIAATLTPAIERTANQIVKWLSNSKNQKTVLDTVKAATNAVATAVQVLGNVLRVVNKVTGGTVNTIKLLVGALVAFKALQMAASVTKIATSFGLLAGRTTAAGKAMTTTTASARALNLSLLGKAGLYGAVLAASFALTTMILKATGLDKKLKSLGASAFDAAAKIGLVKDPGAQFKGKPAPGQKAAGFIRRQAGKLERGGMTPEQAAKRLAKQHPNLAPRDIRVLAGVGVGGVTINGGLHLHGVQNVAQMDRELHKRAKQRAHPRRGQGN